MDLDRAEETFAKSADLTVGVEEEFSILDPRTLELIPRFEQLRDAAREDPLLRDAVAGELISSEIEIISGRARTSTTRWRASASAARVCSRWRARRACTGATGTHPWRTTASSRSSTPSTTAASRTA